MFELAKPKWIINDSQSELHFEWIIQLIFDGSKIITKISFSCNEEHHQKSNEFFVKSFYLLKAIKKCKY